MMTHHGNRHAERSGILLGKGLILPLAAQSGEILLEVLRVLCRSIGQAGQPQHLFILLLLLLKLERFSHRPKHKLQDGVAGFRVI